MSKRDESTKHCHEIVITSSCTATFHNHLGGLISRRTPLHAPWLGQLLALLIIAFPCKLYVDEVFEDSGFCMGMGLPAVLLKWVPQVWVWCGTLAHCDTPHTYTLVSQVFTGFFGMAKVSLNIHYFIVISYVCVKIFACVTM